MPDLAQASMVAGDPQVHLQAINAWSPDLVIVDEGQRIKNWNTIAARALKREAIDRDERRRSDHCVEQPCGCLA